MVIRVRGDLYTPSWTYLNYALRPRDTLNLHVRISVSSTEGFGCFSGLPQEPQEIFHSLLDLLCRFIYNGPSFMESNPSFETPGPHFINVLSVQIDFQEDYYTPATWANTAHEIFRRLKALSLLDTAHRHIGRIRASTAYTYRGHETSREQEWVVCESELAAFTESEWSEIGFDFGDAWLRVNRAGRHSEPRKDE